MSCKNLKIRSKKYKKYFYCSINKSEINIEICRECEFKEYKKAKKIQGKKHKQTKATDIPKKIKLEVWERDNHKCILCGEDVLWHYANAHFIKRSQGGLGIKENIVTLCSECHFQEDFGLNSKVYEQKIEIYLKSIYGEKWDKNKLIYRKGI